MSNNIGWCDETINPIVGCSKCSPGCDNCYAERFAARLAKNPTTAKKYAGVVDERGKWTGKIGAPDGSCFAKLPKAPRRVFVGSMADLFHPQIPFHWLDQIFLTFLRYPQHTFLVLTKRPERAAEYFPYGGEWITDTSLITGEVTRYSFPIPNLWLGVTVCNQAEADAKIPVLLQIPASKRFVSEEVPYVVAGIVILFAMQNGECQADHNADFCAANDPQTALRDIDEILRLRAEVARLEKESDYLATRLSIMVDRLIALKAAREADSVPAGSGKDDDSRKGVEES